MCHPPSALLNLITDGAVCRLDGGDFQRGAVDAGAGSMAGVQPTLRGQIGGRA